MAEGLLKVALREQGVDGVEVGSAGVAAMPGQFASQETVDIVHRFNGDLSAFKSRQITRENLSAADLIVAMTASHAQIVRQHFPEVKENTHMLTDFVDSAEGLAGEDVPDPIGMGMPAYQGVADVMMLAMPNIIKALGHVEKNEA